MKRVFPLVMISIALSLVATWVAASPRGSRRLGRLATVRQRAPEGVEIPAEPVLPEGATA
jgi:hypothetical protein